MPPKSPSRRGQDPLQALARQRAKELKAIRRLGEVLAGDLTRQEILNTLRKLIWNILPLTVLGLEVNGPESQPFGAYKRQRGVPGAAFRAFASWLQAQVRLPARDLAAPPFPAMLREEMRLGGLTAVAAGGRAEPFSPGEAELFRIFVLQGQAALKSLVLVDEMQGQAVRDGLTGLYNHRYFWELLKPAVETARRYGRPLSLIFLDLDDFKAINDTLGHLAGDLVLKQVAVYLKGAVRQADVVCRYGGEEYAVLLAETNLIQAQGLAERLRAGIAAIPVARPGRETTVTASLGAAQLQEGMDGAALVKAADAALYQAKTAGKNRVCAFRE